MRNLLIKIYMLLLHPVLFVKHTMTDNLLVHGRSHKIKTKGLKLGKNVRFGNDTRIQFFGNGKLTIGDNCYFVDRNSFLCGEDITIGANVLFASDILVTSENHRFDPESEKSYGSQPLDMKPVTIGGGCWIGEKTVILPGVQIGKKCVVGAGSVVTRDIPDYSIAVGNPARVIKRYDFTDHKWKKVNS